MVLIVARGFGEVAERFGQPAAVGELLAGIAMAGAILTIGPEIEVLRDFRDSSAIEYIAQLGIFFVVLLAGIEMKPEEVATHGGGSLLVAIGGVAVPLAGGFALGWYFLPESGMRLAQSFLVGVAMSITAIPVTVRVFDDLGLLHTRVGETVVAAAIFDDIIGLFLLAILTALMDTGSAPSLGALALMLGKVALFFAVTVSLGVHVYPRISQRIREFHAASTEFAILMIVALAYSVLAELLGMHWIMGVFLAGLFFEPSRVGNAPYNDMKLLVGGISGGFVAPVFFVSIGLRINVDVVQVVPGFLLLAIGVAFFSKVIGAGLPALLMGLSGRESLATGVGMSARGAVELIVLGVAFEGGLLARHYGHPVLENLYSSLVVMAVVTTLLSPMVLRLLLGGGDGSGRTSS